MQVTGVGVGLRTEHIEQFSEQPKISDVDFLEVVPENWMSIGGKRKALLEQVSGKYPLVCHGLSLSIGGSGPLNIPFIHQLKQFFNDYDIQFYSEHLSYCTDQSVQLYDLMPLPFTDVIITHVIERIKTVQSILQQPLVIENVSYYYAPNPDMSEIKFLNTILEEADCLLLLDVNNVYVNSVNHDYCPKTFIKQLPSKRIKYIHIAGHYQAEPNLIIDTHGAEVIPAVLDLLDFTYQVHGVRPTLLERDNDVPPLDVLLAEMMTIKAIYQKYMMVRKEDCRYDSIVG